VISFQTEAFIKLNSFLEFTVVSGYFFFFLTADALVYVFCYKPYYLSSRLSNPSGDFGSGYPTMSTYDGNRLLLPILRQKGAVWCMMFIAAG
jgi:hypothetical protein